MKLKDYREASANEVEAMEKAWAGAPLHIKAMAAQYVAPLVGAIGAMNEEMQKRFEVSERLNEVMKEVMDKVRPHLSGEQLEVIEKMEGAMQ